ncbi:MAG: dethiobiotin synthase [Candidatus Brocadiia bacterium]
MKPFLILGTDTGVGKTHFALRYLHYCSENNHGATVFKPFASGVEYVKGRGLINLDIHYLAEAAGVQPKQINFQTFERPLAPAIAAEIEKLTVDVKASVEWCRARIADNTAFEGAGGILVPLTNSCTLLDLACELDLPVVLVTRMALGTINHTLLSVEAIRSARLRLAMVVTSMEAPLMTEAGESSIKYLKRHLAPLPIRLLPHVEPSSPSQINERLLFDELRDRLAKI